MNKWLLCSLAALAMAMGVGTTAVSQSSAPVVKPDGSAGAGLDPRKARLDVTRKATESGKRADF